MSRSQNEYMILSNQGLLDVRAGQRTFEGAYMRTSLSALSFALVILKVFQQAFFTIGTWKEWCKNILTKVRCMWVRPTHATLCQIA